MLWGLHNNLLVDVEDGEGRYSVCSFTLWDRHDNVFVYMFIGLAVWDTLLKKTKQQPSDDRGMEA